VHVLHFHRCISEPHFPVVQLSVVHLRHSGLISMKRERHTRSWSIGLISCFDECDCTAVTRDAHTKICGDVRMQRMSGAVSITEMCRRSELWPPTSWRARRGVSASGGASHRQGRTIFVRALPLGSAQGSQKSRPTGNNLQRNSHCFFLVKIHYDCVIIHSTVTKFVSVLIDTSVFLSYLQMQFTLKG